MDSSHTCTMLCRITITSAAERSFFSRSSARSTAELPLSTDSRALEATGPRFPLLPLLVRRLPPVLLLLRITPLARMCTRLKKKTRRGPRGQGDQCSTGIDRGRAQRSCPVLGAPGARSGFRRVLNNLAVVFGSKGPQRAGNSAVGYGQQGTVSPPCGLRRKCIAVQRAELGTAPDGVVAGIYISLLVCTSRKDRGRTSRSVALGSR